MNDAFVAGLRSWHDFFMLTGTAAATLIGLVFVAVSLGGNTGRASIHVMQTFVSPIVMHFGYVLLFAAVILVPTQRPVTLALAIFIVALFTLIEALAVLRGLVAHHRAGALARDKWVWNFVVPLVASLAALSAATEVLRGASWALELLAGASVLFVVAGINNTWRLVMWILEHRVPEPKTEE